MQVILLGLPGAGKSTQAWQLAQHFGIPHLSMLDLLQQFVNRQSDRDIETKLKSGEIISPDALAMAMIQSRLNCADTSKGWILADFPNHLGQAQMLDCLLHDRTDAKQQVFYLDVELDRLAQRLAPQFDDDAEFVERSLQWYRSQLQPVLNYYQCQNRLTIVDGNTQIEAVTAELTGLVARSFQKKYLLSA